MVKMRDSGHVQNQAIYVVLGVDLEGQKEVLGLWVAQQEGAKFWLQVLTELKNRGVKDIFIACVDGLKGFPEAIEAIYPQTEVAALHRAPGTGFAELCTLEAPQVGGGRSTADLSCGHGRGSQAESAGGNAEMAGLSQRLPGMGAKLGSHHAFFSLSGRYSQGNLYHQQRGVGAETTVSGDPASRQKVDHAGAQLEPSLKLLHGSMARAYVQAGQVSISASCSYLRGRKGRGTAPFPCNPSPETKSTTTQTTKTRVIYTEKLTHPFEKLRQRNIRLALAAQTAGSPHGPWRLANSPALQSALPIAYFDALGLPRLLDVL